MNKNVTQNVANLNSEDLTELYHKGKLPKGYYYLKKPDGEVMIITPSLRFMVDGYSILAEVPSFEELQNQVFILKSRESELVKKETQRISLMTKLNDVNNENHALEIENTQLKELLKEVQSKIRYSSPRGIETFADLDDTLLGKINQVLGDSRK